MHFMNGVNLEKFVKFKKDTRIRLISRINIYSFLNLLLNICNKIIYIGNFEPIQKKLRLATSYKKH